jgi:hypothetical protein
LQREHFIVPLRLSARTLARAQPAEPPEATEPKATGQTVDNRETRPLHKRGRPPDKRQRAAEFMVRAVERGEMTLDELTDIKRENLPHHFAGMGSRNTLAVARKDALRKLFRPS